MATFTKREAQGKTVWGAQIRRKGHPSISATFARLPEGRGIPAEDWHPTPTSGQHPFLALLKQGDALAARLHRDASNSSRPPSTDAPSTKRQRRTKATERRPPGAKPGHPGHQQMRVEPTATVALVPDTGACAQPRFADLVP